MIKAVNDSIHTLEGSNLFLLGETAQQNVPEATKVVWLVTKYGFKTVNTLCQTMKAIPSVLTRQQRLALINTSVDLDLRPSEIEEVADFIENQCPSLANESGSEHTPSVFAPPVGCCLKCSQELVAYHSCKVRYFTCTGAVEATKVTLRCVPCRLLYNYSQFGDKHNDGFRYYPVARPAVEITDGQLIDRNLLEFQCCLA